MINFSFFSFLLQTDPATQSILLKSDKVYAVLAVVSVIFVAFVYMMIRNEMKIRKLEKEMK